VKVTIMTPAWTKSALILTSVLLLLIPATAITDARNKRTKDEDPKEFAIKFPLADDTTVMCSARMWPAKSKKVACFAVYGEAPVFHDGMKKHVVEIKAQLTQKGQPVPDGKGRVLQRSHYWGAFFTHIVEGTYDVEIEWRDEDKNTLHRLKRKNVTVKFKPGPKKKVKIEGIVISTPGPHTGSSTFFATGTTDDHTSISGVLLDQNMHPVYTGITYSNGPDWSVQFQKVSNGMYTLKVSSAGSYATERITVP
jgi:hypothetical protein